MVQGISWSPFATLTELTIASSEDVAYDCNYRYLYDLPSTLTALDAPTCVLSFCCDAATSVRSYAPDYAPPFVRSIIPPRRSTLGTSRRARPKHLVPSHTYAPDTDLSPQREAADIVPRVRRFLQRITTLRVATVSPLRALCQQDALVLLDRFEVSHLVARRLRDDAPGTWWSANLQPLVRIPGALLSILPECKYVTTPICFADE